MDKFVDNDVFTKGHCMNDHRRNGPHRNGRPVTECYIHTSIFVALFTIADLAAVNLSAAVDLPVDLEAVAANLSVDLADVAADSSVDSAAVDSTGR